ncbi:unnamed protein product, partial [Rotaria socialis]
WHNVLKQNPTSLLLINQCLDDIKYPHTFNRRPRDFSTFMKWKASELRTFMLYMALPILVKLRLNMPDYFPSVYLSHFILLFIYIRVLRHFNDRDEIRNMSKFIHIYLTHFSRVYNPCKELYSVHALIHLWQEVEQHGGLGYHSLFAFESCLYEFEKLAHGSTLLCEQISFWWCVFRQIRSREVRYSSNLFTDEQLILDNLFDNHVLNNYRQEFDLVYNQMLGEFPNSSLRCYSRYQHGLIIYHSISYTRRGNSNSYDVCAKDDSNPVQSNLYYGQILFFSYVHDKPFLFLKRYVNSNNTLSSLLKPMEDVSGWSIYIDKYYPLVRHSIFELVIIPCSYIVSKCILFQLDREFSICTQIDLEAEHD